MQHLDEGTIHSWLDGALSGDEAARVDAHVKECPECAAAVAEARGFIAASSRILTALDNAPRGVIPAAAPRRRIDPFVWRVAATVMVVAVGTLVVFKSSGRETEMATASADTASQMLKAVGPMSIGDETTSKPTPPTRIQGGSTQQTPAIASKPIAPSLEKSAAGTAASDKVTTGNQAAASPQVTDSRETGAGALQFKTPVRPNSAAAAQAPSAIAPGAVPSSVYSTLESSPSVVLRGKVGGVAAEDARSEIAPLKVIGTPKQIGARITLYEVAPGDTVKLTELLNAQLSAVVTTGIAMAAPQEARSAAKSGAVAAPQRADPPTVNAPDSQSATSPFARRRAPSAPAAITVVEVVNGVTTLTWPDAITGNVLKLSGRIPETRLQQIKLRIERERAAAAAKKTP